MSGDHSPLSPQLRSLLLLGAIFASGAVAGVALDRLAFAPRRESGWVQSPEREDGIPKQLKRLGLTPEQEQRMRAISQRWQPQADSVMQELFPKVRQIEHGMFQEMACVLTPAQADAYLEWRKEKGLNQAEGEEQLARVREGRCGAGDVTR